MRTTYCPWFVDAPGILGVYENITHPLQRAVMEIEDNGVFVDKQRLLELADEYAKKIEASELAFWAAAGDYVRYQSPGELRVWLYNPKNHAERPGLGLDVIHRTKRGNEPSTDIKTLIKLISKHKAIAPLLELKRNVKIKKDFLDGLPDGKSTGLLPYIQPDSRVHTSFRVDGTDSGRLSSSAPNMQNIAKAPDIRGMFRPREGYLWIECDYSQLELRVIANLSGDRSMQEALETGDMHRATAANVIYHVPPDEVTKAQRDSAKSVNFGIAYDMGPSALAFQLGISFEEAADLIRLWYQGYRGVDRWKKERRLFAITNGYSENIFGRRRHLPFLQKPAVWDPDWKAKQAHLLRVATNFLIQSAGSDFLSLATISLVLFPSSEFEATGAVPILSLHDALYFECPEDTAMRAAEIIKEVMEEVPREVFGNSWELPADAAVGRWWGDPDAVHI